jgi:hypothetical protein
MSFSARFHDAPAATLERHRDLVTQIYAGAQVGLVVRGVVRPAHLSVALERLLARQHELPRHEVAPGVHTFGCMLAPTLAWPRGPSLEVYFRDAERFSPFELFAPDCDLEGCIAELLSRLSAERPASVPTLPGMGRYAGATVRVYPDGTEVPLHCDTYPPLPCHAHKRELLDPTTQLSWYLPLSLPERGGEIRVYDARFGNLPQQLELDVLEREVAHVTIEVRPGDLLVFDGGRYVHRVLGSRGPTPRRTLGGFAGLSKDHARVHFWS